MTDDEKRFAKMLWKSRYDSGMSQEKLAEILGISRQTVASWENGNTHPDFYQGIQWFKALGLNPMNYFYAYSFKQLDGIDGTIKDDQVDECLNAAISVLTVADKRRLLFLLKGAHGGSRTALLDLFNAYLQTPLRDRLPSAALMLTMFRLSEPICPDNVMPDVDILDKAIKLSAEVIKNGGFEYEVDGE